MCIHRQCDNYKDSTFPTWNQSMRCLLFHRVIMQQVFLMPIWLVLGIAIGKSTGFNHHNEASCNSETEDSCASKKEFPYFLGESVVTGYPGHWPSSYCRITNVYLNSIEKTFYVGIADITSLDDECYGTRNMWPFASRWPVNKGVAPNPRPASHTRLKCDQVFRTGYVFSIYYYHGSNYFHLHYDAAIPIYYTLHHFKTEFQTPKSTIFMPSVEASRGQGTDWDTEAFMNDESYWNILLKLVVGSYRLLPLDRKLVAMNKTFCFHEVYFGTPRYDITEPGLVNDFSALIKSSLHVPIAINNNDEKRKVGFIHRVGRRKILNEAQLISSISSLVDVELVDFSRLSFEQQVHIVQKYHILIGMNGAGLVNAIYLPSNSVAVQLIPYKAQLNTEEYKKLLKARGNYLDWYNVHANLSKSASEDHFNNNADTYVQVDEFVFLVKAALDMCK